ncbi:Hypothetical predicted protein [Pelobates cultripes]|uniref:Uncharacterized protein n=1 Tax=Pelobates cultripes TaxID=61616 RepID=A0AAD1RRM7_PELCU|nr:Hypothetical predicted protein [Pelobates cultripes]
MDRPPPNDIAANLKDLPRNNTTENPSTPALSSTVSVMDGDLSRPSLHLLSSHSKLQKQPDLKESIDNAVHLLQSHSTQITLLETRQSTTENRLHQLQSTIRRQNDTLTPLQDILDDLNWSRRNNLRFVGFPESLSSSDIISTLQSLLQDTLKLGTSASTPIVIERAHRLGPERPGDTTKSRPIIAKFLNFNDAVQHQKKENFDLFNQTTTAHYPTTGDSLVTVGLYAAQSSLDPILYSS